MPSAFVVCLAWFKHVIEELFVNVRTFFQLNGAADKRAIILLFRRKQKEIIHERNRRT
jgi:hypothetical protein